MHRIASRATKLSLVLLLPVALGAPVAAQAPPEVQGVEFADQGTLRWFADADIWFYNVYRGDLAGVDGSGPARCHGFQLGSTAFKTPANPGPGAGSFYLVTAEGAGVGEGSLGSDSSGAPRPLLGPCTAMMESHAQQRAGFGWGEWTQDRIRQLGLQAYVEEQLDPASIDESTNFELSSRLGPIDPPLDPVQLISQPVIRATYARRQLEQQMAMFWTDHFSTFYPKVYGFFAQKHPPCSGGTPPPYCDPNYPERLFRDTAYAFYRDVETFRTMAFTGTFRRILEASATSPPMLIYLDSIYSTGGNPNENYPRELLELYSLGVDGGYTQGDVEEVARILTGWVVCRKDLDNVGNPLAPCQAEYWVGPGEWDGSFDITRHDCGAKTLFAGTPQEVSFPGTPTCSTPADAAAAIVEFDGALDAIANHPSTAAFISTKILQRLVTDTPTPEMVARLVTVWGNSVGQLQVGNLRAVTRAALTLPQFLDPDRTKSKIKTPFEQFVSALRATRGSTDGFSTIANYLLNSQNLPHYAGPPNGYPELGEDWVDTGGTLQRQNYGISLVACLPGVGICAGFGSDPIALLNDNGVSTLPGNTEAIVDFLAEVLFGGSWTPLERQRAIDYLDTDDLGNLSSYDDIRIREVVAFLLGYPHFQEQ